jgi:hypothetical protein
LHSHLQVCLIDLSKHEHDDYALHPFSAL